MLRIIGWSIIAIIVLAVLIIIIARVIHYFKIKIDPEVGIQWDGYYTIGGLQQYVQIRGRNRNNPLLVLVHGGPGEPFAFLSYAWQLRLEKQYTLVHWNQRQSGRTYFANRHQQFTVSFEALMADLAEVISTLQERYQQPIFLMGHSWGTAIAVEYLAQHPQTVAGYIGVGQMVDFAKEAEIAYDRAYHLAAKESDTDYIIELRRAFHNLRTKLRRFQHSPKTMEAFDAKKGEYLDQKTLWTKLKVGWLSVTSPLLTMRDLQWLLMEILAQKRYREIQAPLTEFMMQYHNSHYQFQIPVIWISGDEDYETPYLLVKQYYDTVEAPQKAYVELHGVGHSAFLEDAEQFCNVVIQQLAPYR
ncbi:MAG: alpha/beta hydrolase [Aerococcus sp.]|nr:alpha/beta hydrolase [Aerococcus sp.]